VIDGISLMQRYARANRCLTSSIDADDVDIDVVVVDDNDILDR
jgi:hypothetical protein